MTEGTRVALAYELFARPGVMSEYLCRFSGEGCCHPTALALPGHRRAVLCPFALMVNDMTHICRPLPRRDVRGPARAAAGADRRRRVAAAPAGERGRA